MKQNKIYALVGTHSSGKSTLINALKNEKYIQENYFLSESSTRSAGTRINKEAEDIDQLTILAKIKQYEIDNDLYSKNCILDRSFIDFYAYSVYLYYNNKISEETLNIIRCEFEKRVDLYTKVFVLVPQFDIDDDGVRSLDVQFQQDIQNIIFSILDSFGVPYMLVVGKIKTRVRCVINNILVFKKQSRNRILKNFSNETLDEQYICKDNIVLIEDRIMKGFISFEKKDNGIIKIGYIFTKPEYRKDGVGRELVLRLIDTYIDHNFYIYITETALVFYSKIGISKFILSESKYSTESYKNYLARFSGRDLRREIDTV